MRRVSLIAISLLRRRWINAPRLTVRGKAATMTLPFIDLHVGKRQALAPMSSRGDQRKVGFKLPGSLLALRLCGVVLGIISGVRWQLRTSPEHSAVIAISQLGGTYTLESARHLSSTGELRSRLHRSLHNPVVVVDLSQNAWPVVERRRKGQAIMPAGDDDLAALQGFWGLCSLDLSGSSVTDKGMEHLKKLESLQEIVLIGTKVSEAGCRELREALPNCTIRRWFRESVHDMGE